MVMVHPGEEKSKEFPVNDFSTLLNKAGPENVAKDDLITLTKSQLRALLSHDSNINDNPGVAQLLEDDASHQNSTVLSNNERTDTQTNGSHRVVPFLTCPSEAKIEPCPLSVASFSQQNWSSCSPLQLSPTKQLSKLDQKRLQWEKEKAEKDEYHPWGKPGAGAPTRQYLQIPVASVLPRTENQTTPVPYSSLPLIPSSFSAVLDSPNSSRNDSNGHKAAIVSCNFVTQPVKPVPSMFKSSITFGSEDEHAVTKHVQKAQWLKDLEIQREEQRLRKLAENDQVRSTSMLSAHWINGDPNDLETAPKSNDVSSISDQFGGRSHVRGQGFRLEQDSTESSNERREKALKALEYQQAIQKQIEEKQKRLQEEKERKLQEEKEEERRLEEQRRKLQEQYEREQRDLKRKQDPVEKTKNVPEISISEDRAHITSKQAARLKATCIDDNATTLNNLASSSKRSTASREKTPCPDKVELKSGPHSYNNEVSTDSLGRSVQQTATVKPLQVSSHELNEDPARPASPTGSIKKEISVQTAISSLRITDNNEGYITNRVLTPSCDRMRKRSDLAAKDFGTQTDIHYGKSRLDDPESTDQSNTSFRPKRITRVQHSKPYKASRHHFECEPEPVDKPKWGANQPSKAFIRMTDRDPHFTKRKKMQELRKQHWEREIAEQQALRNAKRGQGSLYPPLQRQRIKSSSDGTMGFSSSDFETSQIRSNSPPHRHHHRTYVTRSTCGSAEDVAGYHPSLYASSMPSMLCRRDSQSSDNLNSIIGGSEPAPSRLNDDVSFPEISPPSPSMNLPSMRRTWKSQELICPYRVSLKNVSPPVPSAQMRLLDRENSSTFVHSRRKWSDQESFDIESVAQSHAKSQPSSSDDGSDKNEKESLSSAGSSHKSKTSSDQNPLVNPEVITGRPTPRQDRILQNLSSLRQGLLQKQRELENLIRNPPHFS